RHRRGIGRCDSPGTSNRGGRRPPGPRRSVRVWCATPGSEPFGHSDKQGYVARRWGRGNAGTRSEQRLRPDDRPSAPPSPPPPGRAVQSDADRGRSPAAGDLLLARFHDGSHLLFFFRRRESPFLLHGPLLAEGFIDLHQLRAQLLKLPKLRHLALGLAQSCRTRKRLRHRLALDLAREAEVGPMTGIAGLGAMTVGLTTASHDLHDRTGTQIA